MGVFWNNATCGVETCSLRHIHAPFPVIAAEVIEQMKPELPI